MKDKEKSTKDENGKKKARFSDRIGGKRIRKLDNRMIGKSDQ